MYSLILVITLIIGYLVGHKVASRFYINQMNNIKTGYEIEKAIRDCGILKNNLGAKNDKESIS